MSGTKFKTYLVVPALAMVVCFTLLTPLAASAAERKVKSQVAPSYPELARKMSVSGTVKVEVTVAPNGSVKNVKVIGGHPLLIDAAVDAVKRWKYEAGTDETTQVVEFKFSPAE